MSYIYKPEKSEDIAHKWGLANLCNLYCFSRDASNRKTIQL